MLTFHGMLYELAQGKVTKAQIEDYFELTPEDKADLQWLIDRYNAQPNAAAKERFVELVRVLFLLAESRVPGYTTSAELAARINAI